MGLDKGLVISGAVPAAQMTDDQLAAQIVRDELWVSNYRDVAVLIDVQDDSKLGITEDDVRTKVELRLRQADIRPHPLVEHGKVGPRTWVFVQVKTFESAVALRIDFCRYVSWILANGSPASQSVSTWSADRLGIHGDNRAYVLSGINDQMDIFLNAYLKANQ